MAQGERVILFHGLTTTPLEMQGIAEALTARGIRCIAPLFAGHGTTIDDLRRTPAMRWIANAEAAYQSALELGDAPLHIVGMSFGALFGLYLSAKYAAEVRSLVVLAPPYILRNRRSDRKSTLLSFLPEGMLDRLGTVAKKSRAPGIFQRPRDSYDRHSIGGVARLAKIRRALTPTLCRIRARVMILQDPFDHHLRMESPLRLADALSSAHVTLELVPGGEHELLVGPEWRRVNERICSFIGSNE